MRTNNNQNMRIVQSALRRTGLLLVLLSLASCGTPIYRAGGDTGERERILDIAQRMLGTPYRFGGSNPQQGFDCSGLVYYAHQQVGINLPRTTGEQYRSVQAIPRRALQPGDLVFFRTRHDRFVSHVGIYLGDGRFIHAPSSGSPVTVAHLEDPYWRRNFSAAGRVF
jgi:cell wall-associated NlpC family hydrolase